MKKFLKGVAIFVLGVVFTTGVFSYALSDLYVLTDDMLTAFGQYWYQQGYKAAGNSV